MILFAQFDFDDFDTLMSYCHFSDVTALDFGALRLDPFAEKVLLKVLLSAGA